MKRSKTYQVCDCRHWELSHQGNAGLGLLSITVSTASMEIRFRWRLSRLCSLERRTNAFGSKILHAHPRFGPVHMYKLDISDGFYRVHLATSGVLKLGVCLPPFPGQPPLVAFPLVLPMGWTNSPPIFSAFTETIADLANCQFSANKRAPIHPLEPQAGAADYQVHPARGPDLPPAPVSRSHRGNLSKRPLAYVDVFVDDFLGLVKITRATLLRTSALS